MRVTRSALVPFFVCSLALVLFLRAETQTPKSLSRQHSRPVRTFNDPRARASAHRASKRLAHAYDALPLGFEPNAGQTDPSVQFMSHGADYAVFLTANAAVVSQQGPDETDRLLEKMDARTRKRFEARRFYQVSPRFHRRLKSQAIRIALEGASPSPRIVPFDGLPGKANYFIGPDAKKWRTGIPTYAKVQYTAIYPGIDLIYYGKAGRLEFDFVVAPGVDPNLIRLHFDAPGPLSITKDGELKITGTVDSFELLCPEIYQVRNGERRPVLGRFVFRRDKKTVGIQVTKYDHHAPLIIDPALTYSTFVGGNGTDYDSGVAIDAQGDAYIAGTTNSTSFPTYNGYAASGNSNGVAFVTKLNPTGSAVLYSTYLGGTGGDWGAGMALGPSGKVYVTGSTLSTDFPLVNAFQTSLASPNGNAFAAVIDTTQAGTASLVYSTYLGGGGNGSNSLGDVGLAIAADSSGFAYVTGQTASDASGTPFPTTTGAVQSSLASTNGNAFLTVLDTNGSGAGSLFYSTYLGGASSGFGDYGDGITADGVGGAYLAGQTTSGASAPYPTTSGAYQATLNSPEGNVFVTEIATTQTGSQALVYSTYLGGSTAVILGDLGSSIGLDSTGKIYVGGDTTSMDFPVTSGVYQTTNSAAGKAFVAAFDPTKSGNQSLVYSTFLGGTNGGEGEVANAIAVDGNGDAFVSGSTSSSDFPTTGDAFQTAIKNSSWDAFLTELDPTGASLLYSTYFGGSCADGDLGNGVAIDAAGNAYLSGTTCSSDLPTTSGVYQAALAGTRNAFVAELPLPTSAVSIQVTPQNSTLVSSKTQQFSAIATLNNGNTQDMTTSATWSSSDTSVVTLSDLPQAQGFAIGLSPGTANITATLGTVSGSTALTVVPVPPTPVIASVSPTSGQGGTQVTVTGSGFGATQGQGYLWLGSTIGVIVSWSDTQIVASVAGGSTSGSVQITQSGLQSNTVNFTIATPTITSVTPASGIAGTQVTITGSGFGASQGSGQAWLGTVNGIVSSWSDTQVVATVGSGSSSGSAQILQGGVWSNYVTFTINTPVISGITPASGASGTSVTFTGSGFGSSQGSGSVWIGGAYASVTAWSGTQVVATVGANAVTGIAKIQQNGIWSNAVTFTVPPPLGSGPPLTLVPNVINMAVGDTRSIQAVNASNQPVTGLTWTSSDTTVLTLSTDDPPILTAVAAGNVTIFAGNASADVTVYPDALPAGTLQWSNPGDGSGVYNFIPAVPGSGEVDVFALEQSGNIQAIRADGTIAWTASLPTGGPPVVQADFQGGAIVSAGNYISKLDATTGQVYPAYVGSSSDDQTFGLGYPAIHTDGTIFTIDYQPDAAMIVGVDPLTGTAKFSVSPINGSKRIHNADSCFGSTSAGSANLSIYSYPGLLSIAGDGYAYTTYLTYDKVSNEKAAQQPLPDQAYQEWDTLDQNLGAHNVGATANSAAAVSGYIQQAGWLDAMNGALCVGSSDPNCQPDFTIAGNIASNVSWIFERLCNYSNTGVDRLHILRVGTDGSSSDTIVKEWKYSDEKTYTAVPDEANHSYHYTETQVGQEPLGAVPYMITNADQGALFSWGVSVASYCPVSTEAGCSTQRIAPLGEYHLTTSTGSDVVWTVPGLDPVNYYDLAVQPILQLQDGSFVGTAYTYPVQMLNFNQSGNIKWSVPNDYPGTATADGGVIAGSYIIDSNGNSTAQNVTIGGWVNWQGNAFYELPGTDLTSSAGTPPDFAPTYAATYGGNQSGNGTPILEALGLAAPSTPLQKQLPPGGASLNSNYNSIEILTTTSPDTIFSKYLLTFNGAGYLPGINDQVALLNAPPPPVTGTGQNITFVLNSWVSYVRLPAGCGPFSDLSCSPLQGPFTVQTERFDTSADTISVVTMTGHPLEGWRYFRVFSVGTNDLVVETGAVDTYAGGGSVLSPVIHPLNCFGYYWYRYKQMKIWEEDLRYILKDVQKNDPNAVQGTNPQWNVVKGAWNPQTPSQSYILNNVCQSTSCN